MCRAVSNQRMCADGFGVSSHVEKGVGRFYVEHLFKPKISGSLASLIDLSTKRVRKTVLFVELLSQRPDREGDLLGSG